jgi:SAM-dependent methyltransferase/uncharacterized protein YbaR (Trm112 family)
VNLALLESLGLVCPGCKTGKLQVSRAIRKDGDDLVEGILGCTHQPCQGEFPVIDGIPLLARDVRRVVTEQLTNILARDDLSETVRALVGECSGSSSPYDTQRQHISSYSSGHWDDLDPAERGGARPSSIAHVLERGLERLRARGRDAEGPVLDLGCSVGRTTFELAQRGSVVVGVDLNFGMLRVARRALFEGRVRYARRRGGLLYEERSFEVPRVDPSRVALICADALALPFSAGQFRLVTSFNLLDCVPSPLDHLKGMRDVLQLGGALIVACPFDWSPAATSVEAWIGGHSPRGPVGGDPAAVLRQILGGDHPVAVKELALTDELRGLEWLIRLHDRSLMRYAVDVFIAERRSS